MLTSVLIKLGMMILTALPVERIVAAMLNKWLDKIDKGNMDAATKTAQHLGEIAELFAHILEDKKLTEEEVRTVRAEIIRAREILLERWAAGKSTKSLQTEMAKKGMTAEYVEPLLSDGRTGGARVGLLGIAALAGMVLLTGCLTRTRENIIHARYVNVTVNVNDPETMSENALPRSLMIFGQEQMIEGGTDTIASGNKTPMSVQVPMGDSAMSALGSLLSGAVKGAVAPAKTATDANAECADGSCEEK